MSITVKQKAAWIKALKSGKYSQTWGRLKRVVAWRYPGAGPGHCCLGVLAEVIAPQDFTDDGIFRGEFNYLPEKILPKITQLMLSTLNDRGDSFEDIAKFIQKMVRPSKPKKLVKRK